MLAHNIDYPIIRAYKNTIISGNNTAFLIFELDGKSIVAPRPYLDQARLLLRLFHKPQQLGFSPNRPLPVVIPKGISNELDGRRRT